MASSPCKRLSSCNFIARARISSKISFVFKLVRKLVDLIFLTFGCLLGCCEYKMSSTGFCVDVGHHFLWNNWQRFCFRCKSEWHAFTIKDNFLPPTSVIFFWFCFNGKKLRLRKSLLLPIRTLLCSNSAGYNSIYFYQNATLIFLKNICRTTEEWLS